MTKVNSDQILKMSAILFTISNFKFLGKSFILISIYT